MKRSRVYRRGDKWAVDLRPLGFGKKILGIPAQASEVEAVHAGYAVLASQQQRQQQEQAAAQKLKEMTPEVPPWEVVVQAFTNTVRAFDFEPVHSFEEVRIPQDRWPEKAGEEQLEWWFRKQREELLSEATRCGPKLPSRYTLVGPLRTLDILRAAEGDPDLSVATWLRAGLHMLQKWPPYRWRWNPSLAGALARCLGERQQTNTGVGWKPKQDSYPYPVLTNQVHDVSFELETCEDLVHVLALEVALIRLQWSLVAMRPAVPSGQDDPHQRLAVVP